MYYHILYFWINKIPMKLLETNKIFREKLL